MAEFPVDDYVGADITDGSVRTVAPVVVTVEYEPSPLLLVALILTAIKSS